MTGSTLVYQIATLITTRSAAIPLQTKSAIGSVRGLVINISESRIAVCRVINTSVPEGVTSYVHKGQT